ncbi:MAG: type II toxin-antitoxin system PemK/MazF family toxin [Oscillospiraceae bacterium]|jgi:mRNA interferase MazF|nr:type II toxin-antitoxin system PemK/MazF family toxin [Oscillospiraceae bacterium]
MYTPIYGDIIWLDFDPQSGHEQSGRRPAIVVNNSEYHIYTKTLTIVCPITNANRHFPLHVPLDGTVTTGYIMCEQVKALDISSRNAEFIERAPNDIMGYVTHLLTSFLHES